MTLVDRLVDAWVWFNDDPEDPFREAYETTVSVYDACYWHGHHVFFAGLIVLVIAPRKWKAGLVGIALGAVMMAISLLPILVALGVAQVVLAAL